jgi:hypothetical protein
MDCNTARNNTCLNYKTDIFSIIVVFTSIIILLLSSSVVVSAQHPVQQVRPRLVIPPPTTEQFAAPDGPKALPMEIVEARAKMGWGSIPSSYSVAAPGQKLAIIDAGFRGIKEWLDQHPEERKHVTLVTATESDEESHGYDVYRVARTVLSMSHLLLYTTGNARDVLLAIDDAAKRGAMVANISLGWLGLFEIVAQERMFIDDMHKLLSKHEMFVFFAIGNSRKHVHSWVSADRNKNGYVDFHPSSPQHKIADALHLVLTPGFNSILFTWDAQQSSEAAYELELVTPKGNRLAVGRVDPKKKLKGYIVLEYKAAQRGPAFVRVKQLTGPANGIFMRLRADPIADTFDFNGLQTANTYTFFEHPFLIFVGGVGKTEAGKLAPSAFSDIGMGPDGALFPHVLGPGQLILDGREVRGTSFASPFITAIYTATFGYNLKNLMELTASHAPLDPAVAPHERSRWGVPDAMKTILNLRQIVGPTKIEDVSHMVEKEELVLNFSVTRRCMEGLTWWVSPLLYDPKTGKALKYPDTQKTVEGIVLLKSDKPDFIKHPAQIRIPLKGLESFKTRPLGVAFRYGVRTWGDRGWLKVDKAPSYRLKF